MPRVAAGHDVVAAQGVCVRFSKQIGIQETGPPCIGLVVVGAQSSAYGRPTVWNRWDYVWRRATWKSNVGP